MNINVNLTDTFKKLVKKNSKDEYNRDIIEFAVKWSELMEKEVGNGISVYDIAEQTCLDAGLEDITLTMLKKAVDIISEYWVYGKELDKWYISSSVYCR